MYSPLAGVDFNRSSQVACRSLTLRGASALPRKSFLPGFLQTKLCLHVLSLVCVSEFCSCCRQENQRQREGFFLYLTPQQLRKTPHIGLFVDPAVYFQSVLDSGNIFSDTPTHDGRTLVWPESFFCLESGISAITDGEGRRCHPQTLHLLCFGCLAKSLTFLAAMSSASFDVWLICPLCEHQSSKSAVYSPDE